MREGERGGEGGRERERGRDRGREREGGGERERGRERERREVCMCVWLSVTVHICNHSSHYTFEQPERVAVVTSHPPSHTQASSRHS